MRQAEYNQLAEIVNGKPFEVRPRLTALLPTLTVEPDEEVPTRATRTGAQNRALWKFFQLVADKLTERGVTMRKVYEKTEHFDVPPTRNSVHDLWVYFQERMYGTNSTRDLDKHEQIQKVHQILMKNLGELFYIDYIDFPSDPMPGVKLTAMENLQREDYPEMTAELSADQF